MKRTNITDLIPKLPKRPSDLPSGYRPPLSPYEWDSVSNRMRNTMFDYLMKMFDRNALTPAEWQSAEDAVRSYLASVTVKVFFK